MIPLLASVVLGCLLSVLGVTAAQAAPVSDGDVLVADQSAGTIRHYSASGADLGVFADGLVAPSWITADASGNIYVSEYTAAKVEKFAPTGEKLLTITTPFTAGGVAVGNDGTIFVARYFGGGVQRYSALGDDEGLFASTPGLARGDFMAFDPNGNLYVTDFITGVVRRISPTGIDLGNFLSGLPTAFPAGVLGIVFDGTGNLYAANDATNTVTKYSPMGADLGIIASGLNNPYGVALDSADNLYVAAFSGGNIRKFSTSGADLGVFASGLVAPRDVVVVRIGLQTIVASADTFLREGAPNTNEGANPQLRIQSAGSNRAVVAFDLSGVQLDRVTRATLVLTIAENADNWGRGNDRTVDAHPLLVGFVEGDGKTANVANGETFRGSGAGVTWTCAADSDIANHKTDCPTRWNGGDFGPPTATPVTHFNGLTGDVEWDVTADVLAGATGWLIKKTREELSGRVSYYSKEGADEAWLPDLAPRLIIELE